MKCFPFFHKYKVVNTRLGREGDFKYPLTCISWVCTKCGKLKARIVEGHFTKEDLSLKEAN